ncbi:armadillo-type protein [Mycena latifolia]|nr:armadillo-type protein [Mycena latifolia]
MALLRDGNFPDIKAAINALYRMITFNQGSQTAVDANIYVTELLQSPSAVVRRETCHIVRQLARQKFATTAVLVGNQSTGLMSCLRDKIPEVVVSAAWALYWIRKLPEGRKAVADANVAVRLAELLESPDVRVQRQTCQIMEELASDKSATMALIAGEIVAADVLRTVNPCPQLISLWRDGNADVSDSASHALHRLSDTPQGAQAECVEFGEWEANDRLYKLGYVSGSRR